MEKLVLVDKEDDAQETKGEGVNALKRSRKQEAFLVNIESSEEMESIELPEVQEIGEVG